MTPEREAELTDSVRHFLAQGGPYTREVGELVAELRKDKVRLEDAALWCACSYCGHRTEKSGRTLDELNQAIHEHILTCDKRPELAVLDRAIGATAHTCMLLAGEGNPAVLAISNEFGAEIDRYLMWRTTERESEEPNA